MATPTIIDQLIVRLGMDPRQFTQGQKEAAASVVQTENQVRRSGDGMSRTLTGLAAKWLSVAAVIAGVKATVNVIDGVARRTRQLGIDSRNYGLAAAELRNFENAVEMVGGSADDARKTVAGFQRAVFDLAFNGQMSDSLVMLARLGVQFQTSTGQARDFRSIMLDTTDAIAKAQQDGMSRENAFQFLQQAGFDQGTAELMLSGRAQVNAALAQQAARRQVSGADFQKAADIMTARIGKEQALEGVKIGAMQVLGGAQENINEFLEQLASGTPSAALEKLTRGATNAGTALENWALRAAGITRGVRNNNPGNLKAVGDQRRDREGFRVFASMDEGVRVANEQLDRLAKRGINTIDAIAKVWAPAADGNDVENYIKNVTGQTGIGRFEQLSEIDRAAVLAAMFRIESGKNAPSLDRVADILTMQDAGPSPLAISAGAIPTPTAQNSRGANITNVDIDQITVNTQAKDAQQMAADMDAAVSRKFLSSHAERGMN